MSQKVNVITRVGFKFIYFEAAVQHFNNYVRYLLDDEACNYKLIKMQLGLDSKESLK